MVNSVMFLLSSRASATNNGIVTLPLTKTLRVVSASSNNLRGYNCNIINQKKAHSNNSISQYG